MIYCLIGCRHFVNCDFLLYCLTKKNYFHCSSLGSSCHKFYGDCYYLNQYFLNQGRTRNHCSSMSSDWNRIQARLRTGCTSDWLSCKDIPFDVCNDVHSLRCSNSGHCFRCCCYDLFLGDFCVGFGCFYCGCCCCYYPYCWSSYCDCCYSSVNWTCLDYTLRKHSHLSHSSRTHRSSHCLLMLVYACKFVLPS